MFCEILSGTIDNIFFIKEVLSVWCSMFITCLFKMFVGPACAFSFVRACMFVHVNTCTMTGSKTTVTLIAVEGPNIEY